MKSKLAQKTTATTLLEAVRESLLSTGRYNRGDVVPPAAILWTDADGQWQSLVIQLRTLMPELLTLGEYCPEEKTGPAIWLRCVLDNALLEIKLPDDTVPIIYMPDVSRQSLRAVEECPDSLKPLVELQYRGTVWMQRNGKDWTVEAFLSSPDGGLGLDLAKDKQTRRSMLGAIKQLAVYPVSRLRGKRLEAEDFDKLMIGDTTRDLLVWLNDPAPTRALWEHSKWEAFCNRCRAEFGFDPENDGEIVGGEKLGLREDAWKNVWLRFEESPALYPNIPELLRRSKPARLIFDREPWPDENAADEEALQKSLLNIEDMNSAEARRNIAELEKQHGVRRGWVWHKLGWSPLAEALKHLVKLAQITAQNLGGDTPDAVAALYTDGAYLADDAVLRAMESVKTAQDLNVVRAVIRSMYLPWLEDTARHLQDRISTNPLPGCTNINHTLARAESGECLLFVDGLRYDIGRRFTALADDNNLTVSITRRWAGLPSVTATTKPIVSPISDKLSGLLPCEDFLPAVTESGSPLTTGRFRKMLTEAGYQVFDSSDVGEPDKQDARGWTEFGEFDLIGHTLQSKMASRIDEQLELLLERLRGLLEAGWKKVRVVTDHGWLLVPGGLPSIKLPKYLTESRWTRCAAIKAGAHVEVPTAKWFWNEHEYIAYGPGVHCFINGEEYTHGGVSLQECVIPEMVFSSKNGQVPSVNITEIKWIGMRCRVAIEAGGVEFTADLRTKPNNSDSSITTPKQFDAKGQVALLVSDDSLEDTVVSLVILDSSGRVIGKQMTTVGGEN
jgi:hypothetical protein